MKTLVLGLDGATYSILDPLVAEGVMPFFGELLAQGTRAVLRSTVPPLTPPAWTSIMTGRSPGRHGIFDFFCMESPETRHIRFATSRDVTAETIWSVASRSGKRVVALNFPLMYPPPAINGLVVPGWVPWRALKLACHPDTLFDRLKTDVAGFQPRELAMDIKLEEKATEGVASDHEHEPWVRFHIRREENWFGILEYLMREDDIDLAAVVFDGVDKIQHLCWRFLDPVAGLSLSTVEDRRIRDVCLEYFRRLDGLMRKVCEKAGDACTVLVVSDHGFGATTEVFHVNAWLEQRGYLAWSQAASRSDEETPVGLGVGRVARHTFEMDWTRTRAFATTPTSNGIFIAVDRDGRGAGIRPSEYQEFRARLAAEIQDVRDPDSGEPIVRKIWTREEAFPGAHLDRAPDLTLSLRDGGLVSILPSETVLRRREQIAGAHRPEGIFVARGPGVRRGATVSELSILDVAPSILHALGLPVPEDLEGRVPAELFEPEALRANPVSVGPATQAPDAPPAQTEEGSGLTPEHERLITERLRRLGYIE